MQTCDSCLQTCDLQTCDRSGERCLQTCFWITGCGRGASTSPYSSPPILKTISSVVLLMSPEKKLVPHSSHLHSSHPLYSFFLIHTSFYISFRFLHRRLCIHLFVRLWVSVRISVYAGVHAHISTHRYQLQGTQLKHVMICFLKGTCTRKYSCKASKSALTCTPKYIRSLIQNASNLPLKIGIHLILYYLVSYIFFFLNYVILYCIFNNFTIYLHMHTKRREW